MIFFDQNLKHDDFILLLVLGTGTRYNDGWTETRKIQCSVADDKNQQRHKVITNHFNNTTILPQSLMYFGAFC